MKIRMNTGLLALGFTVLLASFGCAKGPATRTASEGEKPAHAGLPQNSAPNALSSQDSLREVQAERDKYWENARDLVYRSTLELIAQHQTELDRGLKYTKFFRGSPTRKWIALTFDDGPHPDYTPALLDILKRYNAKATFFVVGEMAEKHPELIRAETSAGHSVGNHTYDHVSLIKIPDEYVATEIKACGDVLQAITGKSPTLFRPPGGAYDPFVAEAAESLGYTMVLWTDDPGDYASPGISIIEKRLLQDFRPGGVLLLHDGIQQTVDLLPAFLQRMQAQGYEFVTIDQMLAAEKPGSPVRMPAQRT